MGNVFTSKMGCNCNDCHQRYQCGDCLICAPLRLCIIFEPSVDLSEDPYLCCFTTKYTSLTLTILQHQVTQRPLSDPPTVWLLYDFPTCGEIFWGRDPDTFADGLITCGDASLTISYIEITNDYGVCTFRVVLTESYGEDSLDTIFEYVDTDIVETQTVSIAYSGIVLSGVINIAPCNTLEKAWLNDKYRRECGPKSMGEDVWQAKPPGTDADCDDYVDHWPAPNGAELVPYLIDIDECHTCPPCLYCRCLPRYWCIGYVEETRCGRFTQWHRVKLDLDTRTLETFFTVSQMTDDSSFTTTRTVRINFCYWTADWEFYLDFPYSSFSDNYPGQDSLFTFCGYNLTVDEFSDINELISVEGSLDQHPDESGGLPQTRYAAERLCSDTQQDIRTLLKPIETFGLNARTENVLVRFGWCGCPPNSATSVPCPHACQSTLNTDCNVGKILYASVSGCPDDMIIPIKPILPGAGTTQCNPPFSGHCLQFCTRLEDAGTITCDGNTITVGVSLFYYDTGCVNTEVDTRQYWVVISFVGISCFGSAQAQISTGQCDPLRLEFNLDPPSTCSCCDSLTIVITE